QRMRELAVQASNDTLSGSDRTSVNQELQQLKQEINGIAGRTKFNGKGLLDGTLATSVNSATSTVQAGFAAVAGTNTSVTSVDVTAAKAGTTFTMTDAAGKLTLDDGAGNSQTLDLPGPTVAAG